MEQGGIIYEKTKKGVDDKIALRYESNRANETGREVDPKVKKLLDEGYVPLERKQTLIGRAMRSMKRVQHEGGANETHEEIE